MKLNERVPPANPHDLILIMKLNERVPLANPRYLILIIYPSLSLTHAMLKIPQPGFHLSGASNKDFHPGIKILTFSKREAAQSVPKKNR